MSPTGIRSRAGAFVGTPAARIALVGIVLGAAIAAVLAALLLQRPAASSARALQGPVTVKRALSTPAALFGDPVEAEIDVYSEDAAVPARSVRVSADFRPYRVTTTTSDRVSQGGVSLLRTRITLACLVRGCLPPRGGSREVRFPPFVVTYRQGGRDARITVPWAPLQLSSRLPRAAAAPVGVIDTAPPFDPRFERSPGALRAIFVIAAILLGIAGTVLVVTALWPSGLLARRRLRHLSPLERSLLRVEAAARDDDAARREALDDLATHLATSPSAASSPTLEERTRALAWGQSTPQPETLTALAQQVRATLNGGVRA